MRGATILLVEDNPLTRKLVRVALAKADCSLLEAADAETACALIEERAVDVVLLDLVLPDATGFEVAAILRAHRNSARAAILAFTGLLSREDEARLYSAGFDGLVTKPMEPSRLLQMVRGHLPAALSAQRPAAAGRHVLVVDDDPIQLKLARFRLGRLGYAVDTAADGIDALEVARRQRPDAIVTDALMPRLDGFGLCLEVRRDPHLRDIPLLLVTSSYVESADQDLAKRAGANEFVVRSADLGDVAAALDRIFASEKRTPSARPPSTLEQVESERALRTVRQLERQVGVNTGLMQRCSTLAAELSVLSTVARSLLGTRNIEVALNEILTNSLDVAATSRGAILLAREGGLSVYAKHGFPNHVDLRVIDRREWTDRLSAGTTIELGGLLSELGDLGAALGPGALLVPLCAGGDFLGILLLDAPTAGASGDDWRAFAEAIGTQVSVALALSSAFNSVLQSQRALEAANAELERRVAERTRELREQFEVTARQRDELLRLQRQKEELTALVVHDLKTPLAVVTMDAQFALQTAPQQKDLRESLESIDEASRTMLRMVMNLLDISRSEDGAFTLHRERVDVRDLFTSVERSLRRRVAEKSQRLEVQAESAIIDADTDLLRRVLENLVDNACRYTQSGGRIALQATRGRAGMLDLLVCDEGPGIPPDDRSRIFEKYAQVEGRRHVHGRGLGLLFCKLAVEAHGGRIWIEENLPKGTRFCIQLTEGAAA